MVNQKHVHEAYGPVPPGPRYPTDAADLVGSCLITCYPELTPAAARVICQHMHATARHSPHLGSNDVVASIGDDFDMEAGPFHGPDPLVRAVDENTPLPAFLAEGRRIAKREHYAEGGVKEDLEDAARRGAPSRQEVQEAKHDLMRLAELAEDDDEGGGLADVLAALRRAGVAAASGVSSAAKSDLARHLALEGVKHIVAREDRTRKAVDFAREDVRNAAREDRKITKKELAEEEADFRKADMFPRKTSKMAAKTSVDFADVDIRNALKKSKGKITKKQLEQIVADLDKPRPVKTKGKRKVQGGSLYTAFGTGGALLGGRSQ